MGINLRKSLTMKELSNRHMNTLKNTFPDLEIQKEVEPQTQLDELNDYLRLLADMDNITINRKLFLLEGYMNKVISQLKNEIQKKTSRD
jgi:hypothetical protein